MSSLHFKGRVFVESFHLGGPVHELTPMQVDGVGNMGAFRAAAEALTGTLFANRRED